MPSYTLRVHDRFEAAHALRSYEGHPEPIHGHSWRVELVLRSETLDDEGMAFDFVKVKKALADLVAPFHHQNINDVPPFDRLSPTTEHLARWFYLRMAEQIGLGVLEVTVWEGPDCSATYRP